jgi:uncharacterized protein YukE
MGDHRERVRVAYTFTPPEAGPIANAFRAEANQVRNTAQKLRSTGGTLNSSWEGRSHDLFMGQFNPQPTNLESYASWLDNRASYIENLKVTEYRWEWK